MSLNSNDRNDGLETVNVSEALASGPSVTLIPSQVRRKPRKHNNSNNKGNFPNTNNVIINKKEPSSQKDDFHKRSNKYSKKSLNPNATHFVPNQIQSSDNTQSIDSDHLSAIISPVPICDLCADTVDFWAFGICNHCVCSLCALRIRVKNKDRGCSVCKQHMEVVIIHPVTEQNTDDIPTFQSFGIDECSQNPGYICDYSIGIIIKQEHRKYYEFLNHLRSNNCPYEFCDQSFLHFPELQSHLNSYHHTTICSLCYEHRPLFISEFPLYSPEELQKHMDAPPSALVQKGDDKAGGHPGCKLCGIRFFDAHHLLQHLRAQHCTCPLCRPKPPLLKYFSDEAALFDHMQRNHLTCPLCFEGMGRDVYSVRPFSNYRDVTSHMSIRHSYESLPAGTGQGARRRGQREKLLGWMEVDPSMPDPYMRRQEPRREQQPKEASRSRNEQGRGSISDGRAVVIPPNMRVAGRVTGTGNFQRHLDDDALERYSDEVHSRREREGSRGDGPRRRNMDVEFPELGAASQVAAVAPSHSPSPRPRAPQPKKGPLVVQDVDSVRPVLDGCESASKPESEAVQKRPVMHSGGAGLGSLAAQLRSIGLAGEVKGSGKKLVTQGPSEREKQLEKERREKRAQMLANAFGVAGEESHRREEPSSASTANGETDLHRPVYPSSLLAWARDQRVLLAKVERRLFELLQDGNMTSVSLSPMQGKDRRGVQGLCQHYRLNTYVYTLERESKKYVSVVKAPDSRAPLVLLSEAAGAPQFERVLLPLLSAPKEGRPGRPLIVLELVDTEFSSTDPTSTRATAPTVGYVIHYLREAGIEISSILYDESAVDLSPQSHGNEVDFQRPAIVRVIGFSTILLEFPTFVEACLMADVVSSLVSSAGTTTARNQSKPNLVSPLSAFNLSLAFDMEDLTAEERALNSFQSSSAYDSSEAILMYAQKLKRLERSSATQVAEAEQHHTTATMKMLQSNQRKVQEADDDGWMMVDAAPPRAEANNKTTCSISLSSLLFSRKQDPDLGSAGDRKVSSNAFAALADDD